MIVFHDFLNKIRHLVTNTVLEEMAKIPRNTLGKHFHWVDGKPNGEPIPPAHITNIVRALCATFGTIEINGWRIYAAFGDPAIIAIKSIPDRPAEAVEVTEGVFEYSQSEYRMLYDDFDFINYFK